MLFVNIRLFVKLELGSGIIYLGAILKGLPLFTPKRASFTLNLNSKWMGSSYHHTHKLLRSSCAFPLSQFSSQTLDAQSMLSYLYFVCLCKVCFFFAEVYFAISLLVLLLWFYYNSTIIMCIVVKYKKYIFSHLDNSKNSISRW